MSYKNLINQRILNLEDTEPEDYWKERAESPIMSKEPFYNYEDGIIPEKDIITYRIDTRGAQQRNPFNGLVCASTGVGKSRFIKNLIKSFHKQGYRILYIEPKGYEMLNAIKPGHGTRILKNDRNESLPIVGYSPCYIRTYLEKNTPDLPCRIKFYSPAINLLTYREIWQSFGIPDKASDIIVSLIDHNDTDLDSFYKKIKNEDLHAMTKQAALASINNLKGVNFFGAKPLPLKEEWDKCNVVVIPYFSRDGAFMNTDVGLVLDLVRDVGMAEAKEGLNNVTKKLIVFDDSFYYAGLSATLASRMGGGVNLAIRNIANCQNNFRTWGIDTLFVVQSPDPNAIFPALIDGCTTKFVSYTENPTALQGKIPYEAYQLLSNTRPDRASLYVDEEHYVFQWIYVQGKTRWTTGFPFDCTLGVS